MTKLFQDQKNWNIKEREPFLHQNKDKNFFLLNYCVSVLNSTVDSFQTQNTRRREGDKSNKNLTL